MTIGRPPRGLSHIEQLFDSGYSDHPTRIWLDAYLRSVNALVGTQDDALSVDDYTQTNTDPTIVKIDVKDAELEVLKGMEDTISRARPLLYIEVHRHFLDAFGASVDDILEFLRSREYSVRTLDHRSDMADAENTFLAIGVP